MCIKAYVFALQYLDQNFRASLRAPIFRLNHKDAGISILFMHCIYSAKNNEYDMCALDQDE